MKKIEADLYLPSVALKPSDLKTRWEMLKDARDLGIESGLMLVLLGPGDLSREAIDNQLFNLEIYLNLPKGGTPRFFIMHSNLPLYGNERLNFLTNPDYSEHYLGQSIELASALPDEFTPKHGRLVSFHLNTMVTPDQWNPNFDFWSKRFEDVERRITQLVSFAQRAGKDGVRLAIENVPIPEFGDWPKSQDSKIPNSQYYYTDLGEPWPLLPWRPEVSRLRRAGTFLTIDISHLYIALRTVFEVARLAKFERKDALLRYMIFESDLEHALKIDIFANQVLKLVKRGDILHVNDASGFTRMREFHGEDKPYKEGLAFYDGEIPKSQLKKIILESLKKPISFVIEVNETDFNKSPNTARSLRHVLELAKSL